MTLKLQNLHKSFLQGTNAIAILRDLSLELKTGEVVAVVGESGSGKSTLLSLLAGFDRPDQGTIFWNEDSTVNWQDIEWASFRKRQLGFVFQSYYLIPYLTALENVALPLRLLEDKEASSKAQALLESLGLTDRQQHLPSQLSGGECQRVAIARALVHRPKLLLADEPTGSLDSKTGQIVLGVLFDLLHKSQQTALIVTHSQEVADRCQKIYTLRDGKLWSL